MIQLNKDTFNSGFRPWLEVPPYSNHYLYWGRGGYTIEIKSCQEQRPGTDMLLVFNGCFDEVLLFSHIWLVNLAAMAILDF